MKHIIFIVALVVSLVAGYFFFKKDASNIPETDLVSLQKLSEEDLANSKSEEGKSKNTPTSSNEEQSSANNSSSTKASNTSTSPNPNNKTQATASFAANPKTPLSRVEQDSVRAMVATMAQATQVNHKPESLIKSLRDGGMGPIIGKDFNEDTGKMIVVRTKDTLPGIRYFHAQYFEDENKVQFLQHLSFEIRPAPDAMETAFALLKDFKKNLSKPNLSNNFIEWNDDDGYSIWLKKLTLEDIKKMRKEPYNSYSAADVGTVQAAIEQSPH